MCTNYTNCTDFYRNFFYKISISIGTLYKDTVIGEVTAREKMK